MNVHQTPCGATTFGYLSAAESDELGYFGGYLIVSLLGRPIEFHCTAPVRPSRAQQILYGPTLRPYLMADQIAGTLLKKAQSKPQIVLTDQPVVLCLRSQTDVPLVHVASAPHQVRPAQIDPLASSDRAAAIAAGEFIVADHLCQLPAGFDRDRPLAIQLLTALAAKVALAEPFDRIHDAIREAQRIGARGTDAQAA
jgi:hypothetical protein